MTKLEKVIKQLEVCVKGTCPKDCEFIKVDDCWMGLVKDVLKALKDSDRVKVVRCKDCKHYLTNDIECPCNIGLADATPDAQYTWKPEPDWFCADGERRESDG